MPLTWPVIEENQNPDNSAQGGPQAAPQVLSIEQLNRVVRQKVEGGIPPLWVKGELSNFKAHSSGHFYFSLKDSKSQIRAVMFRGANSRIKFRPSDGMEVLVFGRLTVYEPRGEYQINCDQMEPVGAGALQKAFEQLKLKLRAEGLFEAAKKRPLPPMPRHIALVTSPTGAAIRDMLQILARRNRTAQITLVPTVVQGEAAAPQIVKALEMAWKLPNLDVVIVGRGGGSIEDLWAFNDETLARTIARSPVPIISAVGHEIDFTIADFVADVRAPTPSAAAELAIQSADDWIRRLAQQQRLLVLGMQARLGLLKERLERSSGRLVDPKRRIQELAQRFDELRDRLLAGKMRKIEKLRMQVLQLRTRLPSPSNTIQMKRKEIIYTYNKLSQLMSLRVKNNTMLLHKWMSLLDSLSPLRVLDRGFTIVKQSDKVVSTVKEVDDQKNVTIQWKDGVLEAKIVGPTTAGGQQLTLKL